MKEPFRYSRHFISRGAKLCGDDQRCSLLSVVILDQLVGEGVLIESVGRAGSFTPTTGHVCDSGALLCKSHIF